MTYRKALQRKEENLNAPDSPDENGSSPSERKKRNGRMSRGIERYFGSKGGNGVTDEENLNDDEDRMDID